MRFVDAHHAVHWSQGGATDPTNLVLLCTSHHRTVHEGGFSVRRCGQGFEFIDPQGHVIPASGPQVRFATPGLLELQVAHGGMELDADLLPVWQGDRMDYDLALEWLLRYA